MELVLKLDKKQLKVFTELANTLKVKHYIVSDEMEEEAIINAIEVADKTILDIEESAKFEDWLRK
jgi:HKD family nuclease